MTHYHDEHENELAGAVSPDMPAMDGKGLKNCPFCDASGHDLMLFCDPEEGRGNSGPSRRVQCAGCNVEAPFYPTEAEAIAAWNRRALAATALDGGGTVEQIAECIWQAEWKRAGNGGLRKVPWSELAPADQERYRFVAREVASLKAAPEADPVAWLVQGEDKDGNDTWVAVTKDPTGMYGPNMPIRPLYFAAPEAAVVKLEWVERLWAARQWAASSVAGDYFAGERDGVAVWNRLLEARRPAATLEAAKAAAQADFEARIRSCLTTPAPDAEGDAV
ncbi:hypothetical protein [Mesorhizobium sp. B2-3-4]|uniref:hypothetical protein n=1 Tax=Mesorhizobium sp. B2-3-4 TaxID=2589959 RepID=UPI001129C5BE|nr:hypothetical protein [Mesorhizobium sp. B2-3-4]TPM39625.1 hypothetical protein FJ967_09090 [Mesorhizobium sp. B2-3-4]